MSYDALLCEERKGYSFKGRILQSESTCHLLSNISSAKFYSKNCGSNLTIIEICALMQLNKMSYFSKDLP
jgi:hypothetical protein